MTDDATLPPSSGPADPRPSPGPDRSPTPEVERGSEPRPSTVMTQPPAAPPEAPPAGSRPPSAPKQPFAEPPDAETREPTPAPRSPDARPQPPVRPDDHEAQVRRPEVRPAEAHPAPPPPPAPTEASRSDDPQAGVDTREISLAALREAAALAQSAPPGVDRHVDLVGAEAQEAADLDAEAARLEAGPDGAGAGETPDATGIDPRIRDRRVAVTRAEGRRRLRILLTVVAVASFIGIAWLIVQSPLLSVKTIKVEGSAQETQGAVQKAAGVETGTALLFVDTGAVERRVEKLPWVAKASVDRELPNDLKITVVERSPVAWARRPVPAGSPEGTLGTIVLVDRFGRVLGDSLMPPAGLPELIGIVLVPSKGASIEPRAPAAAVAKLPDALRAQTGSVIRRNGQAVLQLIQPPGGAEPAADEVRLGNLEDIGAKGAAALAVLDVLAIGKEHVDYVDVRVPGAPATGD